MGEQDPPPSEGLKDNIRGTKKCFVCGPILKSDEIDAFKEHMNDLASAIQGGGQIDEFKALPDLYCFEDFRSEGYKAYGATMLFNNYMGAVNMVNEHR